MGIKQVKLNVNELTIGMFVSGLDRPWTQTPFPLQGFYIRDVDEIKKLKSLCQHVYIDVVKGRAPVAANLKAMTPGMGGTAEKSTAPRQYDRTPVTVPVKPIKVQRDRYTEVKPLAKEVKKARLLHQKVYYAVGQVLFQLDA